ncbi:hypothetical protein K443DRAFT_14805 [Laccaria amethystina LaAM-08-1]|uniref:Unplaced genomic scaffold K443scaffold_544, whole genome shotgun sequence n=1 Tax=Laccaria amethystina LaAM-08-1 TaxID=1095629 RepID=A0A0C9WHC5_9AGAR|nr:hypothetical protein K443DRAFT_14805 [Laccaria amethystina LaAM-08-1]
MSHLTYDYVIVAGEFLDWSDFRDLMLVPPTAGTAGNSEHQVNKLLAVANFPLELYR